MSHESQSSFSPSFLVPFIKPTFWNSYFKILIKPHYQGYDDQFTKYCQTPRNPHLQKVFCCWSSERNFGVLTIEFVPNPHLGQNMANMQNTVLGLLFTVFRWSIFAYHVRNILESLLVNFHLTKLRLIWWTICKILSHALELWFCTTLIVLIIRTTLWSSSRKIVT